MKDFWIEPEQKKVNKQWLKNNGIHSNTVAKLTPWKKKSEFFYALFSASGFEEKVRAEQSDHLRLFELNEIVNGYAIS